jgi:molybdate/tungstate transport system substrate-binding protein
MQRAAYRLHLRSRAAVSGTVVVVAAFILVTGSIGAFTVYQEYWAQARSKAPLIVFSADLYTAESGYLYAGFANSIGIPYATPKGAGSFALATQIAQGSPVSDFISVSKASLEKSFLGNRSSGWGIAFASDQMSIGYYNSSGDAPAVQNIVKDYRTASENNSTSAWATFFADLTSGSVKVGISNPNTDPAGYRAWIVLEAAGKVYANNQSSFSDRLSRSNSNVTGASAAALVVPLQAGQIQFLFMYRSAILSHGLVQLILPREVNLGDSSLTSFYSQFNYSLNSGVQKGGPILLFITVPNNSTQTAYALQFVDYVVRHASAMSSYGLVPLVPAQLYNSTATPSQISLLLSDGLIVESGTI